MRTGRVEEASALAKLIGTEIQKNNSVRLTKIQGKSETSTRQLWSAVRSLTGQKRDMSNTAGINADVLNKHFAQVSTDPWGALPGGPWPTQNFGWVGHNAFGPSNNWPVCSL